MESEHECSDDDKKYLPEPDEPVDLGKRRFEVISWKATVLWGWYPVIDNCAICRNHIQELCLECHHEQESTAKEVECYVSYLDCGHVYHSHCIERWRRQRPLCPLDNKEIVITNQTRARRNRPKCYYCRDVYASSCSVLTVDTLNREHFMIPPPGWTPATHKKYPHPFRQVVRCLLMLSLKNPQGDAVFPEGYFHRIPKPILFEILYWLSWYEVDYVPDFKSFEFS